MPYRFTNLTSATTYLTSLGFTVSSVMMNWITPLRSSSQRADLFYEGKEVGYLETPTDIQPDEDWCVNIPFEKRSIVPGGVLNAIFGNTEGNEGWENRQFYIETDHFTRFQFGSQLENTIEAQGPGSTIRLKSSSDVLELYKEVTENSEDAIIGINLPELAQQLRYEFADIIDNVAVHRPRPADFDLTGAAPGYVISLDNTYVCRWLPLTTVLGNVVVNEAVNSQKLNNLDADEYINTTNLTAKLTDIVSNNIENGITVIADSGKLHFQANSFTVRLTGAVSGEGVVNNLGDVSIFTTADNTLHNHNDLYVALQGNSVVNGNVGATSFNSSVGTINGFKFLSTLTDNNTTRARIYTIWDTPNVCYKLVIKTEDIINDSISIETGNVNISVENDITMLSDTIQNEYTSKTETGTNAIYNINEVTTQSDNVGIIATNNILLDATNNITVSADQLFSLEASDIQIESTTENITLTSNTATNITTNDFNVVSTDIDMDATNTIRLVADANVTIASNTGNTAIVSSTMFISAQYINVTASGSPNRFYVTADAIDFYTGASTLQTHIDNGIALISTNIVPIAIANGYTLTASVSTETITTTKIINADTFNINTDSFLINSESMAFTGGDATFANDVYINGSLHLAGSSTGGSSLSTADKFVVLNADESGAGVSSPGTSGIEIERGTALNVRLFWNESDTSFKVLDHTDSVYKILTEYDITNTLDSRYVAISGNTTITGTLILNADPVDNLEAATKQYVDTAITSHDAEHEDVFVQITGSTLTGPLMLHDDPINNLQASTKQYVDGRIANHNIEHASSYLALTGGALTGTTTISVAPSGSTDITNKQYVDTTISNTITNVIGARRQAHIIGDGVATTYVIEHNFNSNFYFVNVIDTADMNEVTCAVQHTTLDTVTLFFDTAPAVDSMLVFLMR